MKTEVVAFALGVAITYLKRSVESVIGQKIGEYVLREIASIPRVMHYVAHHPGRSYNCHECALGHPPRKLDLP